MYTFTGVSASAGIAIGPVEQIDHGTTGLHRIVCDPFRERALYDVAVVLAKDELRRLFDDKRVLAAVRKADTPFLCELRARDDCLVLDLDELEETT